MVVATMIAATVLTALLAGVGAMLLPAIFLEHRWSTVAWRDAALALELDRPSPHHLDGVVDGWKVEVSMSGPGKQRVLRVLAHGAPHGFTLAAQTPFREWFTPYVPVTGDAAFDRVATARIAPTELGLLGPEVRAAFRVCAAIGDPVVADGVVELRIPGWPYSAPALIRQVREAVALVEALQRAGGPVRELSVLARTDPVPEVRARMLAALREVSAPAAEAVAQDVRFDPHPTPRLAAARILGDGREALAIGTDRGANLPLRLQALAVLGVDPGCLAEALTRLADDDGPGLRAAVIAARQQPTAAVRAALARRCEALANRSGGVLFRAAGVVVLEIATRARDPVLADAAAVFLRTGEDQLRSLAVRALGAAGTVRSVPALHVAAIDAGALSRLRPAAEAAIRAIQGRAPGSRGSLSLAEAFGGLSLADAGAGAVSQVD